MVHDGLAYESSDNVRGMGRAYSDDACKLRDVTPEGLLHMDPSDVVRGKGATVLRAILNFMVLVSGSLFSGKLIHYHSRLCGFGANCKHAVALAIRNLFLRVLPAVPVASRWTKIGGCLDFIVGGVLCSGVLPLMFVVAFSATPGPGRDDEGGALHEVDIEEWKDQQWHRVTSQRIRAAREFLQNKVIMTKVLILAVVLEPIRRLTTWLLNAAREVPEGALNRV